MCFEKKCNQQYFGWLKCLKQGRGIDNYKTCSCLNHKRTTTCSSIKCQLVRIITITAEFWKHRNYRKHH